MHQTEETERKDMVEEGIHHYNKEDEYIWAEDSEVRRKLEWFQDQKIALMIHWGPYSQLGVEASWLLSDEDAQWARQKDDWKVSAAEMKRQYYDLDKTFNPIRFNPEEWAEIAYKSGVRYLLFTTKHHDGFCMWDTKFSDYKLTSPSCPFHTHKYADLLGHLFESFRRKGIGIGAYFSKADWHVDSYWRCKDARGEYTNRGPSYDPREYPEVWESFVSFTHNQIREIASRYGKLDILWFDGGWVSPHYCQDIRLGEVIEEIRKWQPGLLCVDRTVGGPYENYVTPEQCIPEKPMSVPWESCITLGSQWGFMYEDEYKSPRTVVNMLIDVVAKGGNFAINVGPQPDGRLPQGAVRTLTEVGQWLKENGEAIYGTRICAPYKKGRFAFTQKDGTIYAIETFEQDDSKVEEEIKIPYEGEVTHISLIETGENLKFEKCLDGYIVFVPHTKERTIPFARAFCLK